MEASKNSIVVEIGFGDVGNETPLILFLSPVA